MFTTAIKVQKVKKIDQLLEAEEENLGNKRVLEGQEQELSDHLFGEVVV